MRHRISEKMRMSEKGFMKEDKMAGSPVSAGNSRFGGKRVRAEVPTGVCRDAGYEPPGCCGGGGSK